MSVNSTTLHVRLPATVLERLQVQAAAQRRSVSGLATILLADAVNTAELAATSTSAVRPANYGVTIGEHLLEAIKAELGVRGIDRSDERRVVALTLVRERFNAGRRNRAVSTNISGYFRGLRSLIDDKVVDRDGEFVWLMGQQTS